MSDDQASYTFLSHLRQGIATAVTTPDASAARAEVPITLVFNEKEGRLAATARLEIYGPGEISGLDPQVVIRTLPQDGAMYAQPHYFPFVEFDQPDLPWRYTPAAPDEEGRLSPWLYLIVLAEDEFELELPGDPEGLPMVSVDPSAPLPDLRQAWAWAHVQLSGAGRVDAGGYAQLRAGHPERMVARLICPRRLEARQSYAAFVVPVYKRGRLAGIGEEVKGIAATELAWDVENRGDQRLKLPVYFQWRFGTGAMGDFEYLVTKLRARPLPPEVGQRPMDVSQPGAGLVEASGEAMGLEASLGSPLLRSSAWPQSDRRPFVESLQGQVNQPERALEGETEGRQVAPPLYGRWHAARKKLELDGETTWFDELNADPRLRVAAAMGTRVVQQQQQQLMASAWRQVEGIETINAELRQAQAAREAAVQIYERDLVPAGEDALLQLTAPVHGRIARGEVARALKESPIPEGVFEPQFRRVARRYGPIGRRQGRPATPAPGGMLRRLNRGDLAADRPPATPDNLVTLDRAMPGETAETLRDKLYCQQFDGGATDSQIEDMPFQVAACKLLSIWGKGPVKVPSRQPADVGEICEKIATELDPRQTIPASYRHRLSFKNEDPLEPIMAAPEFPQPMYRPLAEISQDWMLPGLDRVLADTLTLATSNQAFIEAYMVGLNHEMARELLWHEYPTDQRGSYFRQFWDPAGYVAADGPQLDEEALKDIEQIHKWPKGAALGQNRPHKSPAGELLVLVVRGELLKRYPNTVVYAVEARAPAAGSEVHELGTAERHPVFSGQLPPDVAFFGFELTGEQARGSSTRPGWFFVLQEQPSEPGFGLDPADGPRGGEEVETWDELSWGHLAATPEEWERLAYIDLNAAATPNTTKAEENTDQEVAWHAKRGRSGKAANAAALAYITQQKPVRVAIHGSDMLPPK